MTVTNLMFSLPRKGLLPHMGNRSPIFETEYAYGSVMPAAPCIPSPPTKHGQETNQSIISIYIYIHIYIYLFISIERFDIHRKRISEIRACQRFKDATHAD